VSHAPDPSAWGWSSKLSHWTGSLWRARIHQRKRIRSTRDIADGRQHVLRPYTRDGHDGLDGWAGAVSQFGGTAIDGARRICLVLATVVEMKLY
jgi:hypothetical protein